MEWMYYLPFVLVGAVFGLLLSYVLLKKDEKPLPPAPTPHRRNNHPVSFSPVYRTPSPTVRRPPPSAVTNPSVPAPRVRRQPQNTPVARSYDPVDPKDFPICPICSAGNDFGERLVFKIGPRRYRCVEGHEF